MTTHSDDVDLLLKARAEIDERLRKHKNTLTVLFTDIAGSTSFFERNGDTAGLAMIHRHDELTRNAVQRCGGKIVKTIGDSAMAEFPDPSSAVRAGIEIERQFHRLNCTLPRNERVEVRIGIHSGVGYRKGDDLIGDVVNVAARVVKRTAPAQILITRAVYEAASKEPELEFHWLSTFTIDGRAEKEDIFEVIWTAADAYAEVRARLPGPSSIPPRYEVLSQVGTGGTGAVYKVRDLETDEVVALKILKPEIAADAAVQSIFKNELCLARKITHKNVCRMYDFNRSNGTAYTTMEFIEGESLLSRLNRVGALPVNEAFEIARQICEGLREAHAQGIVHRDLKPANIMMERSGLVKIMDFGVARLTEGNAPMTGTIVGTPAYMAPEQAELKPVGPYTDIYALGLVLFEMITGSRAFQGDTPVAVVLKQIREYPRRPREIDPKLSHTVESVVLKCLRKDPTKRFQSAAELQLALKKAERARIVPAWRVSIDRQLGKAELHVRRGLGHCIEAASAFLRMQDYGALTRLRTEPATAFITSVLLGGLISVAVYGGGTTYSSNNLPARRSSVPRTSASGYAPAPYLVSGLVEYPSPNSPRVIASNEVDLNRDSKIDPVSVESPIAASLKADIGGEPANSPASPSQGSRPVKSKKMPFRNLEQKMQPNAEVILESAVQPQRFESDDLLQPVDSEGMTSLSQPNIASSDPAPEDANSGSPQKAADLDAKPRTLYIEVASFKDETWAKNAVEKLTQIGFHTLIVHKTLLWTQSFHVDVGPYSDPKDIEAARQSLASYGFKSHLVN